MSKILIVYYSRTGTTKKLAGILAGRLPAAAEEIFAEKDRAGVIGYLLSGKEATQRARAKIKPPQKNPADYDLAIVGTPIWSWNVSSIIRTYLSERKGQFKQAAFFCTMGGSGDVRAFGDMENVIGLKPIATLALKTKEVITGTAQDKIDLFIKQIGY